MSTHPFDDEIQDNDPTDELPVLTDVILGEEVAPTASPARPRADLEDTGKFRKLSDAADAEGSAAAQLQADLDARDERLSTLESELARLQERWSDTEAKLSERDKEIARLRAELSDRETAVAEQRAALENCSEELRAQNATIAELTAALELEKEKSAELERNSNDLEEQVKGLEHAIEEIETAHAVEREAATQTTEDVVVNRLREEVAALSQHIENRNAIWHEQAEKLATQSTRVRELEIEVARRLERQLDAERFAEAEAASARAAREKLGEALAALKRGQQIDKLPEAAETRQPVAIAGGDHATRLKRELAQTVLVQASQPDDARTLSRLAELEAAIVSLEDQMEAERGGTEAQTASDPTPEPEPEPAKLICLTAAEPTEYLLDQATVTIGRGTNCDIQIGTHYVSREHARVTTTESGCLIEDLGSRNGVFVNAVKVERHDLAANDLITVGDTQFRYEAGGNG